MHAFAMGLILMLIAALDVMKDTCNTATMRNGLCPVAAMRSLSVKLRYQRS